MIALLNKENFVFVIRSKRSNAFLGIVDIHCIYWDENKASIGFWGNARYQRQGYMRQALLLFVNALFTRGSFRELKAYVDVANSSTYIV